MMTTDTLSDVLRSVRLRGAVFYYLSYGHEWAAEAPPAKEIAGLVIPGAEHVMEYHVITKGSGWAAILGESPVRLATGDIVMFPHGDAHIISSAPGIQPTRFSPDWSTPHAMIPNRFQSCFTRLPSFRMERLHRSRRPMSHADFLPATCGLLIH